MVRNVFMRAAVMLLLTAAMTLAYSYAQEESYSGRITRIDADERVLVIDIGSDAGSVALTVVTTADTVFREGEGTISLADLRVGDMIDISGERKDDRLYVTEVSRKAKQVEQPEI